MISVLILGVIFFHDCCKIKVYLNGTRGDLSGPAVFSATHSSFTFAPGLLIWHSKDLVNWRPVGKAQDRYIGDILAPDFIAHEGMYYIYVPVNGKIVALTLRLPKGHGSILSR